MKKHMKTLAKKKMPIMLGMLLVCLLALNITAYAAEDYVTKGFKAFKARKYALAISLYNKALASNSKNAEALNGKGVALAFSGKPELGLKYINQAIKIKPNYLTAYFNAGLANELAGNYQAAISAYKKIIAKDPKNTWSYYGIACSYGNMGDALHAARYLKKAIALDKSVKIKARNEKDFRKIRQTQIFQATII